MGNWQLEVFKMSLYISIPVLTFVIFNEPQLFEGVLLAHRRLQAAEENPECERLFHNWVKNFAPKTDEE